MRLLPYVDGLVLALLPEVLLPEVTVESELSDPPGDMPYVLAEVIGDDVIDERRASGCRGSISTAGPRIRHG